MASNAPKSDEFFGFLNYRQVFCTCKVCEYDHKCRYKLVEWLTKRQYPKFPAVYVDIFDTSNTRIDNNQTASSAATLTHSSRRDRHNIFNDIFFEATQHSERTRHLVLRGYHAGIFPKDLAEYYLVSFLAVCRRNEELRPAFFQHGNAELTKASMLRVLAPTKKVLQEHVESVGRRGEVVVSAEWVAMGTPFAL